MILYYNFLCPGDQIPPTISCLPDIHQDVVCSDGVDVNYLRTATDNCPHMRSMTYTSRGATIFGPTTESFYHMKNGKSIVTAVATDSSNNFAFCNISVEINNGRFVIIL